MVKKCAKCGETINYIGLYKDYPYKRNLKNNKGIHYFCSYKCMRAAERDNGEIYTKRMDV